jgi:hypothetical protein
MPVLESRIIERAAVEVNGGARLRRSHWTLRVAALLLVAIFAACSRSARAERLLEEARVEVKRGRLPQALSLLERVSREYPETDAAREAEKDARLYRGLLDAKRLDPLRRARDILVQTAREIEGTHARGGRWPDTLATAADPWGRPLVYERTQNGYRLASFGADGAPGGEPDLVIVNGRFTEDPLGGNP